MHGLKICLPIAAKLMFDSEWIKWQHEALAAFLSFFKTLSQEKARTRQKTRDSRITHTHTCPPVNAQTWGPEPNKNQKPELWFAAKSQYLYDQSSHLEAKLTCSTAIGRQAGRQAGISRGDSSFCGQEEGSKTGLYWEGRLNLFIST